MSGYRRRFQTGWLGTRDAIDARTPESAWPLCRRIRRCSTMAGLLMLVFWSATVCAQSAEQADRSQTVTPSTQPSSQTSSQAAHQQQGINAAAAWQAVRQGEAAILMRHALAPGTGDPADFAVTDCSTQRNLSDEGRRQAERIGERIREEGITEAIVLSSQWCRCLETARLLGLGSVTQMPALNSFFQDRSGASSQTRILNESLVKWLTVSKDEGHDTPRILVSHQVNITALTRHWARSGEMLIVTIREGNPEVLAAIETD